LLWKRSARSLMLALSIAALSVISIGTNFVSTPILEAIFL
jgi:hypothetical protein